MTPSRKPVTDSPYEIATEIEGLSDVVSKLLNGRLSERVLITLIYDAMSPTWRSRPAIKEMLQTVSHLKTLYIRKSKGKNHAER